MTTINDPERIAKLLKDADAKGDTWASRSGYRPIPEQKEDTHAGSARQRADEEG